MDTPGDPERSPGTARWVVLGLSALLFVCSQFHRVANAVIAPQLQRDLGLSAEALGGVSAAFFYAFAAAQVPLAVFLDRLGARRTMTALSLVGAVGAAVFAAAEGRAGATLGRVLLGVGMAGNLMGSLKLAGHWFSPRQFATVAGVITAVGTVGNILATTPLVLLAGAIGWRASFAVLAAATAAAAVLFWSLVRESPGAPQGSAAAEPPPSTAGMAATLLRSRDYWAISFGAFCRYGTFAAIQGLWAGPFLIVALGLPPVKAANLILLMNLSAVAGAPLGGWLSDRVLASRRRVGLLGLGGGAVAMAALAFLDRSSGTWRVAGVLVLLGVTGAFGQVMYAHIKDVMPPGMAGMSMTGVNLFVMLGAATFLHGMGWIVDRGTAPGAPPGAGGFRAAFLAGAASVAAAFVLYLFTRDRRPAEREASAVPRAA